MKYSSKKSKLSLTKIPDRNTIFASEYVDLNSLSTTFSLDMNRYNWLNHGDALFISLFFCFFFFFRETLSREKSTKRGELARSSPLRRFVRAFPTETDRCLHYVYLRGKIKLKTSILASRDKKRKKKKKEKEKFLPWRPQGLFSSN